MVDTNVASLMLKLLINKLGARAATTAASGSRSRRRIDLGDDMPAYSIYAIGDVHGRLDLLLAAERKIEADLVATGDRGLIVTLGDHIDRGPQSAEVVAHLLKPVPELMRRLALCGNHEAAFLDFMDDPAGNMWWLEYGGRETLLSYGLDIDYFMSKRKLLVEELRRAMQDSVPGEHVEFLKAMPISLRSSHFVFVHAGLRPGIALDAQTDQDMLWIREPFLSEGPRMDYMVIHGHTPSDDLDRGPNRIGIDTNAVATGHLTVLKIARGRPYLLE